MVYMIKSDEDNYLEHHGIKGQKWGVRRFQNEDGTRTNAGLKRDRQTKAAREGGEAKQRTGMSESTKTALKTTALMVGTAALTAGAIYGGMKVSDMVKSKAYEATISSGEKMLNSMVKDASWWDGTIDRYTADKGKSYIEQSKILQSNAKSNIESAAQRNSSSFKNAVNTLRGRGESGYSSSDKKRDLNTLTTKALSGVSEAGYGYEYDALNGRRKLNIYDTYKTKKS